jgi:hypothetical protein
MWTMFIICTFTMKNQDNYGTPTLVVRIHLEIVRLNSLHFSALVRIFWSLKTFFNSIP